MTNPTFSRGVFPYIIPATSYSPRTLRSVYLCISKRPTLPVVTSSAAKSYIVYTRRLKAPSQAKLTAIRYTAKVSAPQALGPCQQSVFYLTKRRTTCFRKWFFIIKFRQRLTLPGPCGPYIYVSLSGPYFRL